MMVFDCIDARVAQNTLAGWVIVAFSLGVDSIHEVDAYVNILSLFTDGGLGNSKESIQHDFGCAFVIFFKPALVHHGRDVVPRFGT